MNTNYYTAEAIATRAARRAEVMRKCGATDADYAGAKPGYAVSVEDDARRIEGIVTASAHQHAVRMEQVEAEYSAWVANRKADFARVAAVALAHLGLPLDTPCKVTAPYGTPYYVARPHDGKGVRSNTGCRVDKGNVCTTIDYTGCR